MPRTFSGTFATNALADWPCSDRQCSTGNRSSNFRTKSSHQIPRTGPYPIRAQYEAYPHCLARYGRVVSVSTPAESRSGGVTSRSPLPRWTVPVVAIAVLSVSATALAVLWMWIDGLPFADADKKAAALLDTVKVAASFAVGGGGLFALYLAARRQRTQELELAQRERVQEHAELVADRNHQHAERVADDARHDAAARRVTEQYGKSVEQLGSDKAHVRLGGLYALERLAQGNEDQRQVTMNVLCAYLRMPCKLPDANSAEHDAQVQELEVRHAAQRVITSHLNVDSTEFWPRMNINLTGATLVDFVMIKGVFRWASFKSATFVGMTLFDKTRFPDHSPFELAIFDGPTHFVSSTFLGDARFKQTTFRSSSSFSGLYANEIVTFEKAARFRGAMFNAEADFSGALFKGRAEFGGPDSGDAATFAGRTSFIGAEFNADAAFGHTDFQNATSFKDTVFTADAAPSMPRFGVPTTDFRSAKFSEGIPSQVEQYAKSNSPWDRT